MDEPTSPKEHMDTYIDDNEKKNKQHKQNQIIIITLPLPVKFNSLDTDQF